MIKFRDGRWIGYDKGKFFEFESEEDAKYWHETGKLPEPIVEEEFEEFFDESDA